MKIENLFPGSFGSDCYVVSDSGHAVVIDPSAAYSSIISAAGREGAVLESILLTHGHFDHILSLDTLRDASGIGAYIHSDDSMMLSDGDKNAFRVFFGKSRSWRSAEHLLNDKDIIRCGSLDIRVIHTPGHTPGSVCYYIPAEKVIFTGDTLFADSYGRCDLPGGNINNLRASLELLSRLDGNITIYPGHGESNTLSRALDNIRYM